jgi:AAA domain, putative AbiEii toxin, Type IV TA system
MPDINFELGTQQGPLRVGFPIQLQGDYIVLVGANNTAKTSILQAIFKKYYPLNNPQARAEMCLILPERIFVDTTIQPGNRNLEQYNNELAGTIGNNNRSYQLYQGPSSNELPRLLLNHTDLYAQIGKLNDLMEYLGLNQFRIQNTMDITFDQIQVAFQGSGLRSIFAILAALTDDAIILLLIDEPEISLEPGLQKHLRDLLYDASKEKLIVLTTHSPLFLNRNDFRSNYIVKKEQGEVSISRVSTEPELYEITFKMLGSSVEDLFFPRNFLVVEGATDQIIVNKVMELKGIDRAKLKVVSASGVDNVHAVVSAIYNALLPLILSDSPYKNTVVALIDKPRDTSSSNYLKIANDLSDRLFELTEFSLEEYLPEDLYARCGRVKAEDLREIAKTRDRIQKKMLKTEIATAIASILNEADLKDIQIIANAADKANI